MANNNENDMVDSNVLRYLQERIKLNIGLIEKLKTISDTIKNEKKFDEIVEAEVVGIFSNWSGYSGQMTGFSLTEGGTLDQMKTILSKIKQNSGQITSWCGEFIKIVEDENKSIYNYINKKPTVMGLGNIISLIENNFGTKIPNIWEQLRLKLGEKANENEYVMSMELKGVEQIGKAYIKLYLGLRSLIIGRNPKNEIAWHSIYENLKEVQKSLSHFTGGYQGDLLSFIDNNKPKYASEIKKFAENFFPSGKSFNLYFQEYLKYFQENGTPTYSNLDETQRKVVDKTLNDSIELLFNGIKTIEKELETSKNKNDDEFKKLKEEYEKTFIALTNELSKNKYNFTGSLIDCLITGLNNITNKSVILEEFRDNHLKSENKKLIVEVTEKLKSIIKNDFLNQFKRDNPLNFPDFNSVGDSNADNLDEIVTAIKNLMRQILTNYNSVSILDADNNKILDGVYESESVNLNIVKSLILKLIDNNLENISENSNVYSCEFFILIVKKITDVDSHNSAEISLFLNLAKNFISSQSVDQLRPLLNSLLKIIYISTISQ